MSIFLKQCTLAATIVAVAVLGATSSAFATPSEEDEAGIRNTVVRYERLEEKSSPSVCGYMTSAAQEHARLGLNEFLAAYPPYPTCRSAYAAYRENLRAQGVLDEALSVKLKGFQFANFKVRGSFASVRVTFDSHYDGNVTESSGKYHLRKSKGRWKFHRVSDAS